MKLTIKIKLQPSVEQATALRQTLELANQAANEISRLAWENQTFKQFELHKLCYRRIRDQYGLPAQVTVRLIAKVAERLGSWVRPGTPGTIMLIAHKVYFGGVCGSSICR